MWQQVMAESGIGEVPEIWESYYDQAWQSYPGDRLDFLQDDYLADVFRLVSLSRADRQAVLDTARVIRENASLSRLAWLWHVVLFRHPADRAKEKAAMWPAPHPANAAGSFPGFFPVVVLFSGFRELRRTCANRGISDAVLSETLTNVEFCLNDNYRESGRWGLGMNHFDWLLRHFRGEIYRLGRLQYEIRTFAYPLRVYRNIRTGECAALSEARVVYRGDGLVDGTNGQFDPNGRWEAVLRESAESIVGHPALRDGRVNRHLQELDKKEWVLQLAAGDPVLGIHIPRDGKLTSLLCDESFASADAFFAKHYPDWSYNAFCCSSWMMDCQLQQLLPESSNLVQFQQRFAPFPVRNMGKSLYKFVFRCVPCEPEQLPAETTLQRQIKQFMLSGGQLYQAGGYILAP